MRKFVIFSVVIAFVFTTGAIFAGGQKEAKEELKKIKIQYMSDGWESQGGESEYYKVALKNFQIKHPNVEVEVLVWAKEQHAKMLAALSTGRGPDVMQVNNDKAHIFGPEGYLDEPPSDVVKMMEEEYYPSAVEHIRDFQEGIVWGPPNYSCIGGCYYNMNLLEAAGLPKPPADFGWAWDELMENAKKLTKFEGDTMTQEGFCFTYGVIEQANLVQTFVYRMYGEGATFQNTIIDYKKKDIIIDHSGLGVKAFKLLADPYLVHKVSDKQFTKPDAAFAANKLAIHCGEGNWAIGTYDSLNPELKNKVEARMIPPLTKEGSLLNTDACGTCLVNASSKHKRIAWDMVIALHNEEALYTYGKSLGIAVENVKAMELLGKEDPRFAFASLAMKYSVARGEGFREFAYQSQPIIDLIQLGKLTSEEGIKQLEQDIKEVLSW